MTPNPNPIYGTESQLTRTVPPNGYAWWYIDILSPDQQLGMTVIFFIGSVFSPAYYRARQRGAGQPLAHSGVNVALYRPRGDQWVMTHYSEDAVTQSADQLVIGRSAITPHPDRIRIQLDDRTQPFPRLVSSPLRGHIDLHLPCAPRDPVALGEHHVWQPIAPVAHAEVHLESPNLSFAGHAYHDFNAGSRGLEDDFVSWNWSRASDGESTRIVYDVNHRHHPPSRFGTQYHRDGTQNTCEPEEIHTLRSGLWGVKRQLRAFHGERVTEVRALEDSPFYTRTWLRTEQEGSHREVMHESIDLDRYRKNWTRFLIGFRMRSGH